MYLQLIENKCVLSFFPPTLYFLCVIYIWSQIHGKSHSSLMGHCALCVNICVLHKVFAQCTLSEKVDRGYEDAFISFH